jgi:hypothetical protein
MALYMEGVDHRRGVLNVTVQRVDRRALCAVRNPFLTANKYGRDRIPDRAENSV